MNNLADTEDLIHFDQLVVRSTLRAIAQILSWFEAFRKAPISQDVWLQGQIALVEAFTNAARHAHERLPTQTPVILEAGLYRDRLEIRVWDQGAPFDLAELIDRVEQDYPEPLEHDAHWGAALFKKLRDRHHWKIEYHCLDQGRNCLRLVKFYEQNPG